MIRLVWWLFQPAVGSLTDQRRAGNSPTLSVTFHQYRHTCCVSVPVEVSLLYEQAGIRWGHMTRVDQEICGI